MSPGGMALRGRSGENKVTALVPPGPCTSQRLGCPNLSRISLLLVPAAISTCIPAVWLWVLPQEHVRKHGQMDMSQTQRFRSNMMVSIHPSQHVLFDRYGCTDVHPPP